MPTTQEIHEIIITGDPKRLQNVEKEYSNSLKRMENADKVATAQKIAGTKAALRETLDQIAQERKARTDAAREITAQQKSQFGMSGDMSQITSWRELLLATRNAKSAVLEFGAATKMVGSDKTYGNWLNELAEKKRVIARTTKLTSEQLLGLSRDLTVVGLGARSLAQDIGDLTSGDKSMGELALGISGVTLQAITLIPFIHGMGREMQAMGIISSATVTNITKLAGGFAKITGLIAVAAGQVYAFKIIVDQTGAVFSALINILGSHSWQDVTDNFYALGQALSDLNPILDILGIKFDFLKEKALDAGTAIQGVLAKEPTAEGSRRSIETAQVTRTRTTSPRTTTEKELISLYDEEQKKLEDIQKQLILNAGYAGAVIELEKKKLEIQERLYFLQTGINLHQSFSGFEPKTITPEMMTGGITKATTKGGATLTIAEALEQLEEKLRIEQEATGQQLDDFNKMRSYTTEMFDLFGGMDNTTKQIADTFFNILQGILSGGQSGGLFGFIFGTITTALSGGVPVPGIPPKLLSNSGDHLLSGAVTGAANKTYVIIKNPITLKDALEVEEYRSYKKL